MGRPQVRTQRAPDQAPSYTQKKETPLRSVSLLDHQGAVVPVAGEAVLRVGDLLEKTGLGIPEAQVRQPGLGLVGVGEPDALQTARAVMRELDHAARAVEHRCQAGGAVVLVDDGDVRHPGGAAHDPGVAGSWIGLALDDGEVVQRPAEKITCQPRLVRTRVLPLKASNTSWPRSMVSGARPRSKPSPTNGCGMGVGTGPPGEGTRWV